MISGLERARRVFRERGFSAFALGSIAEIQARLELARCMRRGPERFTVDGIEHTQLFHLHNRTWRNERAVEVPLAIAFVDRQEGPVLEIGNVLANYGRSGHIVIDKYERQAGVLNVDVLDYRSAAHFGAIVSVSTLEHVGWDEEPRDTAKIRLAVRHLRELLVPSGRLFVTCPLAYNPHLDRLVAAGGLGADRQVFLAKNETSWSQVDRDAAFAEARTDRYGSTAVWIAEFSP